MQDQSELAWFNDIRHDVPEAVTHDEAERALRFAFWWIVALESAVRTYDVARWWRHLVQQGRVRIGEGPARVLGMRIGHGDMDGKLAMFVALTDLPEKNFAKWKEALYSVLSGREDEEHYVEVNHMGELEVELPIGVSSDDDLERLAQKLHQRITSGLDEVESKIAAHEHAIREQEAEAARRSAEFSDEVRARFWPIWLAAVELRWSQAQPAGEALALVHDASELTSIIVGGAQARVGRRGHLGPCGRGHHRSLSAAGCSVFGPAFSR